MLFQRTVLVYTEPSGMPYPIHWSVTVRPYRRSIFSIAGIAAFDTSWRRKVVQVPSTPANGGLVLTWLMFDQGDFVARIVMVDFVHEGVNEQ